MRVVWIGVLGLVACTAINPAYEAGDGDESGLQDETAATFTTTTATNATATNAGDDSSGAATTCELHPPRGLRIHVSRDGQAIEPQCNGDGSIMTLASGSSIFEGNVITHPECLPEDAQCLCTGSELKIEVEGLTEFPAGVPSCGVIMLWSTDGPMGCEWGGLMMQAVEEFAPSFIASRTRRVPPLGPTFELGLEPQGDSTCSGDCQPYSPGRYMLDVVGETVAVDGLMHFVEVAFLPGAPLLYAVENRMASITEECEEQVAWLAVQD